MSLGFGSALLGLALVVLPACGDDGPSEPPADAAPDDAPADAGLADAAPEDARAPTVTLSIRANPHSTIAPYADVGGPAASAVVRIEILRADDPPIARDATWTGAGHEAWLWGLRAETTYTARAIVDSVPGPEVDFTTGSLPDLPDIVATTYEADRILPGLTLAGVRTDTNLVYFGVDRAGEVVWYYDAGVLDQFVEGGVKILDDGNLLIFRGGGFRVITPEGETVHEQDVEFHHDVEPMPNGNFLFLRRRREVHFVPTLGGNVTLLVDGVIEIDRDGTELRQWWASEDLDTTRFPDALSMIMLPDGSYNWSHGNSIEWREDGVALVSFRHQHLVVGIEWATRDLRFKLGAGGDFVLSSSDPADWFYGQHQPAVEPDGTILLFDNGNNRPSTEVYSRALHLSLDEAARTATILWEHRLMPQSRAMGDIDRVAGGNLLVTTRPFGPGVTGTALVMEMDESTPANVVWDLFVDAIVYRSTRVAGF